MSKLVPQPGSRDLSAVFEQPLEITIQDIGGHMEGIWIRNTLAYRVAVALFRITNAPNFSPPKTPHKSDWELVSLDLPKGILVVKRT